ncbi:MAG: acyltransferase [Crocinitomicaceae bacterium]
MDRESLFAGENGEDLFKAIKNAREVLDKAFLDQFDRSLPFNEVLFDRWERAKALNFGEGTSIYDNVLVFGKPTIGKDVWIGPFSIIDGSGGLLIGDNVTISSGVHIYSHDNVKQTLLGKDFPIEKANVEIGNNTYIGPNVVISKNVSIGHHCVVATNSFVNKSFPNNSILAGNPAKKIGEVIIENNQVEFKYSRD